MKRVDIFSKKYYTDGHDVDEESITNSLHGGEWFAGSWVGITDRFVTAISAISTTHAVASRCRHPKLIKYYTDYHDVDEDSRTILIQGGYWTYETGIARRDMTYNPDGHTYIVASLKIRTHYLNNEIVSYKVYMNFKF